MLRSLRLVLMLCVVCLSSCPLSAQDNRASIPGDAVGYVALRPQSFENHPALEYFPWEIVATASQDQLGMEFMNIELIEFVMGNPLLGFPYAVKITTTEPVEEGDLAEQLFADEWQEEKGLRYRPLRNIPDAVLHLVDSKHAFVGSRKYIEKMLKPTTKPGKLSSILAQSKNDDDILIVTALEDFRETLEGFAESSQDKLPGTLGKDLGVLASKVNFVQLGYSVAKYGKLNMTIDCVAGSAPEVDKSLRNAMSTGQDLLVEQMKGASPKNPKLSDRSVVEYVDRVSQLIVTKIQPKQSGDRLEMQLDNATQLVAASAVFGSVLPAINAARVAAERMQSSNNLKQIGLAILNYESAYRRLPRDIVDEEGKPLLSWRVAILPFIEEAQLYQEFHLDEPWDSEHNIQLLDRMPAVFKHPDSQAEPNDTVYLAIIGEGLGFGNEEQLGLRDFTDGTSNTVLLVEASDTVAVPWAAPSDLEPQEDDPAKGLRFDGPNPGCNFLYTDCSVHFISSTIDPTILWALFTRGGGEAVAIP